MIEVKFYLLLSGIDRIWAIGFILKTKEKEDDKTDNFVWKELSEYKWAA